MSLSTDLEAEVKKIISPKAWTIQDATKVPKTEDIGLGRVGKRIEVVALYSDLAGWTDLVRSKKDWFVGEIVKSFLVCAVRIIRDHGGFVVSFDGDRVMAIFHGDSKNSSAAKCALKINYAVKKIITPRVQGVYSDCSTFSLGHCTGIDRSSVLVIRSGIRNNNDLVWIGRAPNYAAKLSEEKSIAPTLITSDVYEFLNDEAKLGGDPKINMWRSTSVSVSGRHIDCYSSTWHWEP